MSTSVKQIINSLTRERVQSALDVSSHSIIAARKAGSFPASWYAVVDALCAADGIECPKSLFNFKTPSPVKSNEGSLPNQLHGNGSATVQEVAK